MAYVSIVQGKLATGYPRLKKKGSEGEAAGFAICFFSFF